MEYFQISFFQVKANIIFFAQPKFITICLESTKHFEVVKEQLHKDPKIILKSHTRYSLVCRWSIVESKWHDNPYKGSPICNEGNVVHVILGYHNLVITMKFKPRRDRPCELPPYLIRENQMASSTRAMNLATSNLSKS